MAPKDVLSMDSHHLPLSPTGLTHAMPRPKSPRTRRPDRFSSGFLAAEHFHNVVPASEEKKSPRQKQIPQPDLPQQSSQRRRRSREGVGRFVNVAGCQTPTVLVAPAESVRTCTSQSAIKSREFAQQFGSAHENVRGCIRGGVSVGRRMTECLTIAADVYKLECSAGQQQFRGDDSMFFANADATHVARTRNTVSDDEETEDNSMLSDSDLAGSADWRQTFESPGRLPRRRSGSPRGRSPPSSPPERAMETPPRVRNTARRQYPDPYPNPSLGRNDKAESSPYRSHKGVRYPQAAEALNESTLVEPPTPRRERLRRPRGAYDEQTFELDDAPRLLAIQTGTQPGTEYTNLQNLRMNMFIQDKKTDKKVVEQARFSRTLQELEKQDSSIKQLRGELDDTRQLLDDTTRELVQSRKSAVQRQHVIAAKNEQLFSERIGIEEKLRHEMKDNEKLFAQISGLQDEAKKLRTTLEKEHSGVEILVRSTSRDDFPTDEYNPQCPSSPGALKKSADSQFLSSTIIELRAEVVELKSQLAEARAEQLTLQHKEPEFDVAEVNAESKRLKEQVTQLKKQINVLKRCAARRERDGDIEVEKLQNELKGMQDQLSLSQQDSLNHKLGSQKLEGVLSQKQTEAAALREQVSKFTMELESAKQEAGGKSAVSEEEGQKLRQEVSALKEKLARSNEEIIMQASGHVKVRKHMEEALTQSQQASMFLQNKVIDMDDQVANAEAEAHELRRNLEDEDEDEEDRYSRATDASRAAQIVRYMNRKISSADTSVMELLRRQRNAGEN